MAAARGRKKSSSIFLIVLYLLLSSLILLIPARGDEEEEEEDNVHGGGVSNDKGIRSEEESEEEKREENQTEPEVVERAIGVTGFMNRWDNLRTWAKLALMKFKPPDSSYFRSKSSPGQVMKEAASRSFESSKEIVEHAAKSAAMVADEAVHVTKEKVKRTVSGAGDYPDAEL